MSFVHCPWFLISLTNVSVPKCTVFFKAVQILPYSYVYCQKHVQPFKQLYNKKLYIFGTLSLALNFIKKSVYTKMYSFPKLYKLSGPHMYVFKKLYNHLKSCKTKEKSSRFLIQCPWFLILFVPKLTNNCISGSKQVQLYFPIYSMSSLR